MFHLFKRKPKKVINSKFHIEDFVRFPYNGELTYGFIWKIKEDSNGNVIYDIQVGAQCPWFAENIPEEDVHLHQIKKWS